MLNVSKVSAGREQLLAPGSPAWKDVATRALPLIGTPTGTQPTPYTRGSWKNRIVGAVSSVDVQICHDGSALFLRLSWADATENRTVENSDVFPDGAAVLFPIGHDAPINTMGNEREGVGGWQWQADSERGRSVTAYGVGTTEPMKETVDVAARRLGPSWQVVISRQLSGSEPGASVHFEPGGASRLGVAIWEGGNGERAGFKAFTENWTDIQLAKS